MTKGNGPGYAPRAAEGSEDQSDSHRVTDPCDIPEYRSDAWRELPVGDPHRMAALVAAADMWHQIAESPHAQEFVLEVIDWRRKRVYRDWSHAVAQICDGRMPWPSYAELERLRAVVGPTGEQAAEAFAAAARRRGGEYCGGAVDWHTGRPRNFAGSSKVSRKGAA